MASNMAIMGKKLGMTRIFSEDGSMTPVTVISAGPCPVVQKKTVESDGYNALQLAFDEIPERKVNKPMKGHFGKADSGFFRHLKEVRLEDVEGFEVGQDIKVADVFAAGDKVKVSGTSKGKGFQGVMKRHNFRGLRATHGAEKVHRSPGSVGHATFPGKVFKNKRMPGQMGNRKVCYKNLEIVDVMADENILLIKGQVPGATGGLVFIQKQSQ